MNKILALSCALALAGLSGTALAAEGQGFARVEIGNSDIEVDGGGSDDDTAYSLRGGYWFTDNLGVEGFYSNLYDKSESGASLELSGFGVGAVAKMNFGPDNTGFFINGRAGVAHVKGEAGVDGFGSVSDSTNKLYYGVGAGYDFNEMFGLSLNYDFYESEFGDVSVDADTLTLGGEFRF